MTIPSYKVTHDMKDNYTKDKQILRQNLGLRKDISQRLDQ